MIETKTILIKVNGMNYKHYLDKGYSVLTDDGKMDRNKEIHVLVADAKYSYGCGPNVNVQCDRCSIKFEVIVGTINHQIKEKNTCYCKNCNDSVSAKERVKVINPGGRKELMNTKTDRLCSGGCGKKATHKSKSGNLWCNDLGSLKCSSSQERASETFKKNDCNNGERNGMFGKKLSSKHKNKISKTLKEKISNGEFTPTITNSWANSKTFLQVGDSPYYFRSSWEAIFWLMNKDFEYEKVRIKYINELNKSTNYIVDFVDYQSKTIYEIKPKSEKFKIRNELKTKAAIKWCEKESYTYEIITEDWFKSNLTESQINEFSNINEKIKNGLKGLIK